ncbi:Thioredoxin H2 [Acorus gramineus]|uniref:Thioredoxin H2 n=1 Tax=Acorus gramineus TaxID=55184 RepID=A0AAV9ASF5_ACOGR|nr:Thioredoxin H2 [Acorus gramineus]
MGSGYSSYQNHGSSFFASPEVVPSAPSTILTFHSKTAWKAHWETNKNSTKLMVMNFTASWCGPCRTIEPTIKALAAKFTDVIFVKIDVDELMSVSEEWKVQTMPTFVLVKKGMEVDKVVGAKKDELERKIERQSSFFASPEVVPSAPSTILTFHSKTAWKAHWETYKNSTKLMVMNFTASWCGPCRTIEPTIKALAAKFTDVVFVKIDVDELMSVSEEWKVQTMPTFVLVKKGMEVDKVVGAKKDELERKIERQRF